MMALLFLSFLSIPLKSIWQIAQSSRLLVGYLLFVKLILLPVSVYFLFHWLFPTHALAALLVSAISPGVTGPFFSEMLLANTSLVTVGMVTGSLLVPVTLPALVRDSCRPCHSAPICHHGEHSGHGGVRSVCARGNLQAVFAVAGGKAYRQALLPLAAAVRR